MSHIESKRLRVGLKGAAAAKQLGKDDLAAELLTKLLQTYTKRQIRRALMVIGRKP